RSRKKTGRGGGTVGRSFIDQLIAWSMNAQREHNQDLRDAIVCDGKSRCLAARSVAEIRFFTLARLVRLVPPRIQINRRRQRWERRPPFAIALVFGLHRFDERRERRAINVGGGEQCRSDLWHVAVARPELLDDP